MQTFSFSTMRVFLVACHNFTVLKSHLPQKMSICKYMLAHTLYRVAIATVGITVQGVMENTVNRNMESLFVLASKLAQVKWAYH